MTNRQTMISALNKYVIPDLKVKGFEGKFPDFKKVCEDYIEMIYFQTNKYGGSFIIEVSVVFPKSEKHHNFISQSEYDDLSDINNIDVSYTNHRYRTDGMFDGWFYYSDVYRNNYNGWYENVSNREKSVDLINNGYECVQYFNENTAAEICKEINKQLESAFKWMKDFESHPNKPPHDETYYTKKHAKVNFLVKFKRIFNKI